MTDIKSFQAPGRILRFMNNNLQASGILLLCDNVVNIEDHRIVNSTFLYQFPLKDIQEVCNSTLYIHKLGVMHQLLDETVCQSLKYDSTFSIMVANKCNFGASSKEDNDKVREKNKDK